MTLNSAHRWAFFRSGGVDQVLFRTSADLLHLNQLDQKLWVALACPVQGLEFDARTLELIDTDRDGRIRAPEILETVQWLRERHRELDLLFQGGDTLPLSAINDATSPGSALLAGARRILNNLGKAEATSISMADVADTARIFAVTRLNGDGIVPPDSALEEPVRAALEDIVATLGGVPDRSGKAGVDQARVDAFFEQAAAVYAWEEQRAKDPAILPLTNATGPAFATLEAVREKVDDYFARCRLAAFDTRSAQPLESASEEIMRVASRGAALDREEIAKLPLARIEAGRPLPLVEGVNPEWAEALALFREKSATPLLGPDLSTLVESDWHRLKNAFAPYKAWMNSRPSSAVSSLGPDRLHFLLHSSARESIQQLIQEDLALESENAQITAVEKLLRLQRDFVRLLNNFVSFADFYARRGSTFQAGTLFLDARSCDLCVQVADPGRHAALAGMSKAYLAYCDCSRKDGQKMLIAAAFTAGDSDYLMVGRNGIFYDRSGRDWDATITRVVENPISIRQAFWSPYKKCIRMVEEQIAKRAATAEAESQGKLGSAAERVVTADKIPVASAGGPKKVDVGTVAAIGVALGSIGTFLGLIFANFINLGWWIPVAFVGLMLAISGPSMLIAWMKLRQRNMGPILDANGWAVNGRVKINMPFGRSLSRLAHLPAGASRQRKDPFAEKRGKGTVALILLLLIAAGALAWRFHLLDSVLPEAWQYQVAADEPVAAPPASAEAAP